MMKKTKRWFMIFVICSFSFGFRVMKKENPWGLSKDDPVLYVRPCTAALSHNFKTFDIPDSDEFGGSGEATMLEVLESVASDFTSIESSFLQIEVINEGDTVNEDHVVDFCISANKSGGSGTLEWHNKTAKGCEIEMSGGDHLDASRNFAGLFAHELGHCLGLLHAQDSKHSVMSYFGLDRFRLQMDDKMGVTYLYPNDSVGNSEEPTFGLSCSPRE